MVQRHLLRPPNHRRALDLISGGLTLGEAGRVLGLTRQRVHGMLARVRERVTGKMDFREPTPRLALTA